MITPVTYLKTIQNNFQLLVFLKKFQKNEFNIMEADWVNGNVFLLKNIIKEIELLRKFFFRI